MWLRYANMLDTEITIDPTRVNLTLKVEASKYQGAQDQDIKGCSRKNGIGGGGGGGEG